MMISCYRLLVSLITTAERNQILLNSASSGSANSNMSNIEINKFEQSVTRSCYGQYLMCPGTLYVGFMKYDPCYASPEDRSQWMICQ